MLYHHKIVVGMTACGHFPAHLLDHSANTACRESGARLQSVTSCNLSQSVLKKGCTVRTSVFNGGVKGVRCRRHECQAWQHQHSRMHMNEPRKGPCLGRAAISPIQPPCSPALLCKALLAKKPSVSKAEFDAMIGKCPKTLDADMVGDLFSVFDKKGDGTISINELKVCVCSFACFWLCFCFCDCDCACACVCTLRKQRKTL